MYWQVLQVEAKPQQRDELLRESKAHAEESIREEPGTVAFFFLLDEQDDNRFYAVEHYTDRAAHQTHTDGQVMKRNAPRIVPMLGGPPVVLASGDQLYP